MFPMWWDLDDTGPRMIRCMRPPPLDIIRAIVATHGITDPRRYEFEWTPQAMLGNFLEAWGQANILPAHEPPPARRARRYLQRSTYQELVW